jgi:GNAT superfamily N-acetyltransferase
VRAVTDVDVSWIADMMERRREQYEAYSPLFWRRAARAREIQEPYLRSCVADDRYRGSRSDHGFVLAELRAAGAPPWSPAISECFIDDFAVDADERWATEGRALLLAVWEAQQARGAEGLRVVTARRDEPKVALLESLGLQIGESWFIHTTTDPAAASTFGPVSNATLQGLVIPAPPVYDPGGPVLLVQEIVPGVSVEDVSTAGAALGAVIVIVPAPATDAEQVHDLERAGFDPVSRFYTGIPIS